MGAPKTDEAVVPSGSRGPMAILWPTLGYAAPWVLCTILLQGLVGYSPLIGGDTVAGMFALGLGWASHMPAVLFHVPITIPIQLSTVAFWISTPSETTLEGFQVVTLLLQAIPLILIALWVGWVATRLRIPFLHIFLVSLVGATMPTVLLNGVAVTGYYPIALCMPAAALVLVYVLYADRIGGWEWLSVFVVIGFIGANIYSSLPFAAVAILGGSLFLLRTPPSVTIRLPRVLSFVVVLVALHSALAGIWLAYQGEPGTIYDVLTVFGYCLLPAFLLTALWSLSVLRVPNFGILHHRLLIPVLIGWLAGANLWAPFWFWNMLLAAQLRGTGTPRESLQLSDGLSVLPNWIEMAPWSLYLLLAIGI